MIYLRLAGGLGNQLYQLTAMSLLSQCSSMPLIVFTDALTKYHSSRPPDIFKLLSTDSWFTVASPNDRRLHRWLTVTARAGRWPLSLGVNDSTFWSHIQNGKGQRPLFADGYFQRGWRSEYFTRGISGLPINSVNERAAKRLMNSEVAIHIRGGDFLGLPRFQVVDSSYYISAVKNCVSIGFKDFAVITDDQAYASHICQQIRFHCKPASIRILEQDATALQDFDTLRSARCRIIGNSTFAWWAVALGATDAPTWSPSSFTIGERRDFFLPNERNVAELMR
jgi:hypothetical protein